MNTSLDFLQSGVLTAGAATLIYSVTVTATVLTAIFARTPQRRKAARDTLALLLRRSR